jgi:hypothetical protein
VGGDPVIRRGVPRFVKLIALVVVIGLATALTVSVVISRQREAQQRRDECALNVLADLVEAANERTTYTEELSQANEKQLTAFNALILASLEKPPPTEAEGRQIVVDYRDALADYFHVAEKAKRTRQNFPYPTEQEILACR